VHEKHICSVPELLGAVIIFDQPSLLTFKVDDAIRPKASSLDPVCNASGVVFRWVLAVEMGILTLSEAFDYGHTVAGLNEGVAAVFSLYA
jgi:hypothetical protein